MCAKTLAEVLLQLHGQYLLLPGIDPVSKDPLKLGGFVAEGNMHVLPEYTIKVWKGSVQVMT